MKNKIKAYRKKIGMSQETLSKNVNVSRQTLTIYLAQSKAKDDSNVKKAR